MITLKQLARRLEIGLNEILTASGNQTIQFAVSPDTADYKPPKRKGNKLTLTINGVLSMIGSSIESTANDIKYSTISTGISFIVPIIDEDESGELSQTLELVNTVRTILDNWSDDYKLITMTDDGGISYQVSNEGFIFNGGDRDSVPTYGDCYSFSGTIDFFIVQGGLNSRDIKYYLNGLPLPIESCVVSRQTISETAVKSSDGAQGADSKILPQGTQLAFRFRAPAVNVVSGAMKYPLQYIEDGFKNKTVHELKRERTAAENTTVSKTWKVVFTEVSESASGTTGVGYDFTLAEVLAFD